MPMKMAAIELKLLRCFKNFFFFFFVRKWDEAKRGERETYAGNVEETDNDTSSVLVVCLAENRRSDPLGDLREKEEEKV